MHDYGCFKDYSLVSLNSDSSNISENLEDQMKKKICAIGKSPDVDLCCLVRAFAVCWCCMMSECSLIKWNEYSW